MPSPVVDPAPAAEPEQPVPTAVPPPIPTATAIPVDLSTLAWLTAHQAAELAPLEADGEVFEIAGHGARGAGELSTGDTTGAELSPGAGYARDWSVTIQNDIEAIFCQVGFGETSCNGGGFHYGDGEVGTVIADSPAALERFESENNPDWQALLAYNDISILFDMHVDLSGAFTTEPGDPIARIWSASITVRDAGASPKSGNFHWNMDTDEVTSFVF